MSLFCNFSASIVFSKADFPDSSKLQPPPENVYPNISGNINSNLSEENNVIENLQNSTEKFLKDLIYSDNTETENNSNSGFFLKIIIFFAIAFVFFIIFIFVRKINK